MERMTQIAAELDKDTSAVSIEDFARRYSIGRNSVYREIGDGRLRAHKCGRRTLILRESELEWASKLPEVSAAHAMA